LINLKRVFHQVENWYYNSDAFFFDAVFIRFAFLRKSRRKFIPKAGSDFVSADRHVVRLGRLSARAVDPNGHPVEQFGHSGQQLSNKQQHGNFSRRDIFLPTFGAVFGPGFSQRVRQEEPPFVLHKLDLEEKRSLAASKASRECKRNRVILKELE
jgi:hypothetical protein